MSFIDRFGDGLADVVEWRHHIHQRPERLYEVQQTAAFVAGRLRTFGCDAVEVGIGRTGVVGLIKGGRGRGRTIGLRADMDALPITEMSGKLWSSTVPGLSHACGHDGHTAMLLGAARHLADTRDFRGDVAVVFQPAEEGGAGALAMVEDGLMERFEIAEIYGMHNLPGLGIGRFAIRQGPIMAGSDRFSVEVIGDGGHAATPHLAVDPIATSAQVVLGLQLLVSREIDALDSIVVSITTIEGGTATNVIPGSVRLGGTVRALSPDLRNYVVRRLGEVSRSIALAHRARAEIVVEAGYPSTINHERQTITAAEAAKRVVGAANVDVNAAPKMFGEDFSYMLQQRPGAFIFVGNGDSPDLHNPAYDFSDEAIPYGVGFWISLVEGVLCN